MHVLTLAGIDASIVSYCSISSASTNAAKSKGVPVDQILSAGDWSTTSTYYDKPITNQMEMDYGISVLNIG